MRRRRAGRGHLKVRKEVKAKTTEREVYKAERKAELQRLKDGSNMDTGRTEDKGKGTDKSPIDVPDKR